METASDHRRVHVEQVNLGGLTPRYLITKRCFDFTASLVGLILLSGLFLVLAVLIKIDDPHGQVFYSQTRLGKDGRLFQMWKFRSMVTGADRMVDKLLKKMTLKAPCLKLKMILELHVWGVSFVSIVLMNYLNFTMYCAEI